MAVRQPRRVPGHRRRVREIVAALALLDEAPHAHLQRLFDEAGVVHAGKEDHRTGGGDAGDLTGGVHTVEHGHGDVQHRHVGHKALHGGYGGTAVRLIGHNLESPLLQQGAQRLPQHEVVVRQHQADRRRLRRNRRHRFQSGAPQPPRPERESRCATRRSRFLRDCAACPRHNRAGRRYGRPGAAAGSQ